MGEFPSQVSIEKIVFVHRINHYMEGTSRLCGGTIINSLHILTAGHCLFNEKGLSDPAYLSIMAGDTSLDKFNSSQYRLNYLAVLCFVHPEYQKHGFKDIAIIRVNVHILFTKGIVEPAALGTGWVEPNDMMVVSGWGRTSASMSTMPVNLRKAHLPYVEPDLCRMSYGPVYNISINFCAGWWLYGGTNTYFGDSGGGLYYNNKVYGIVSIIGFGAASRYYPAVFTNVSVHRSWIASCVNFKGFQRDIPLPKWKKKARTPLNTAVAQARSYIWPVMCILCISSNKRL